MLTNSFLNFYQTAKSPIHNLDPRVKILSALILIFSNIIIPDGLWVLFGLTFGLLVAITLISRVKISFLLKRSLLAIPFALMAFTVIFSTPGQSITQINLFNQNLILTSEGVVRFFSIMVRAWCSVQATIILTATTTFPDLAHGMRHLRLPLILIAILSFMYRYLFVLIGEAQRLLQARSARSALLPGGKKPSPVWSAKNAGNMVGQLFLRSYERSDRVYNAMVVRGFNGEFLTYNPHIMNKSDWFSLILFIFIILGIQSLTIFLR